MNTTKLLNRAPTLIVIVTLAYACYSIHAALPDSGSGSKELTKGLDVMVKDVLQAGSSEVKALANGGLRDPFRIGHKPAEMARAGGPAAEPDTETLAGFVRSLSLDATFLQGKAQIAIISGRMYHQGEHLLVDDNGEKTRSPLYVQKVQVHGVTLAARSAVFELGYPDELGNRPTDNRAGKKPGRDGSMAEIDPEGQLAFYKKLLNSPLGKLGKSITGNNGPAASPSPGGRHRRSHGSGGP
jgi:CubicO group peptidase (beta-lactamase class C family)